MRLTALNVWGGNMLVELSDFIRKESAATDIFCLQEVISSKQDVTESGGTFRRETFNVLREALSEFAPYVTKPYTSFGERLAIFAKNEIEVDEDGCEVLVPMRKYDTYSIGSNLQYLRLKTYSDALLIANVHGFWIKDNKRDTNERIEQSKKIIRVLSRFRGPKILCGDFNLDPDTRSVRMLEESFTNLIKTHSVDTTRSVQANKKNSKFADYIFVSSDVKVRDFRTMDSGASDHLALSLDFQI